MNSIKENEAKATVLTEPDGFPELPDYEIFTDGGCIVNPGGHGGFGTVITDCRTGEIREYSGAFAATTNNRMEIMAVITAMEHIDPDSSVILYADSKYVLYTMTGAYKKKKNNDLWDRLDNACKGKIIKLMWVQGHTGIAGNERCDELANLAYTSGPFQQDKGYIDSQTAENKKAEQAASKKSVNTVSGRTDKSSKITDTEKFPEHDLSGSVSDITERLHISKTCLDNINAFLQTSKDFEDYLLLKSGGMDYWSGKSLDFLINNTLGGKEALEAIKKNLDTDGEIISAMRWYARGISLYDAIRHEQVGKELRQKSYNAKYKKAGR